MKKKDKSTTRQKTSVSRKPQRKAIQCRCWPHLRTGAEGEIRVGANVFWGAEKSKGPDGGWDWLCRCAGWGNGAGRMAHPGSGPCNPPLLSNYCLMCTTRWRDRVDSDSDTRNHEQIQHFEDIFKLQWESCTVALILVGFFYKSSKKKLA